MTNYEQPTQKYEAVRIVQAYELLETFFNLQTQVQETIRAIYGIPMREAVGCVDAEGHIEAQSTFSHHQYQKGKNKRHFSKGLPGFLDPESPFKIRDYPYTPKFDNMILDSLARAIEDCERIGVDALLDKIDYSRQLLSFAEQTLARRQASKREQK